METPDTFLDLFWGYTITWLFLVIFLIRLGCKLGSLEAKVRDE